jgi:hypothetical protein
MTRWSLHSMEAEGLTMTTSPAFSRARLALLVIAVSAQSPVWAQESPPQGTPLPRPLPSEHEENSGQDPTRPVTRVDVRLKMQDKEAGLNAQALTLRADKPVLLGNGWKLSTRADLPIARNNAVSAANPDGDHKAGLGDVLLQGLVIAPSHERVTTAFGTQLLIPTGSDPRFTTGKWQLVPTAAVVYQLPDVSPGTFIGLLIRDSFSFAGKNDRKGINVASIEPIFNWQLPDKWFVTFSPEAKFDMKNNWNLSLPFDMTVGKKIGPAMVVSLQSDVALVDQYKQYDWQMEFRVGFFF